VTPRWAGPLHLHRFRGTPPSALSLHLFHLPAGVSLRGATPLHHAPAYLHCCHSLPHSTISGHTPGQTSRAYHHHGGQATGPSTHGISGWELEHWRALCTAYNIAHGRLASPHLCISLRLGHRLAQACRLPRLLIFLAGAAGVGRQAGTPTSRQLWWRGGTSAKPSTGGSPREASGGGGGDKGGASPIELRPWHCAA